MRHRSGLCCLQMSDREQLRLNAEPASNQQIAAVFAEFSRWVVERGVCDVTAHVYGLPDRLVDARPGKPPEWAPDEVMAGSGPIVYRTGVGLAAIRRGDMPGIVDASDALGMLDSGVEIRYRERLYNMGRRDIGFSPSRLDLDVVVGALRLGGRIRPIKDRYIIEANREVDSSDGSVRVVNVSHAFRRFGLSRARETSPRSTAPSSGVINEQQASAFIVVARSLHNLVADTPYTVHQRQW